MDEFINKIYKTHTYLIDDVTDTRTRDLPLISSPITMVAIVSIYLYFSTSLGPCLMSHRKPFELRTIMKLYNIFQVLLSVFLVQKGLGYLFSKDYNICCDSVTFSNDAGTSEVARDIWWYFFAKLTELLDTVLFVLRKKTNQVSTLHLYHHSIVLSLSWMTTAYFPDGPVVLLGTMNSFIHILMYGYYFVSGLGPQYQKYLWWKRYLTLMQIIQFIIIIGHNLTAMFYDCNFPKILHIFIIGNTSYIMYMFTVFYYNTYIKRKPKDIPESNGKMRKHQVTKRKSLSAGQ